MGQSGDLMRVRAQSRTAVQWVVRLQSPGVAVCQCVWLVAVLRWLVMDEVVVIHMLGVKGLLFFLCVQLDTVLQLCICPLDGGELHVMYCAFGFSGVVGDDPAQLERYCSPEHRLLDYRLPH